MPVVKTRARTVTGTFTELTGKVRHSEWAKEPVFYSLT